MPPNRAGGARGQRSGDTAVAGAWLQITLTGDPLRHKRGCVTNAGRDKPGIQATPWQPKIPAGKDDPQPVTRENSCHNHKKLPHDMLGIAGDAGPARVACL